jgi:protein-disulfide isomerase
VARKPKVKAPAQKSQEKRPSGRMVVLAFAVAIGVTLALVAAALFLREDESSPPPSTTPAVDLSRIPQEGIFLGDPAADVTLIEYADLQCPFCRMYTEQVFPTVVDRYVRPGRVRTEFRGVAFIGEDSMEALRYVQAAGLQNRLWEMQDGLYRNQGAENSGWVTEELAREVGGEIDGLDVDRMLEDADGDEVTARIDQAATDYQGAGVQGTPTFFIQIGDEEPYRVELTSLDATALNDALDDALRG